MGRFEMFLTLWLQLIMKMTTVMIMTSVLADFTPHHKLTLTLLSLFFCFFISVLSALLQ